MPNDSSTGGILAPSTNEAAPLNGQALNRFLQQWIVGITGLPGDMVRPSWQNQTPDIPKPSTAPNGSAWCAFAIKARRSDKFPFVGHVGDGNGYDQLIRNEELEVLISFYDLGTNGLADQYAELMRDGAAVAQNREYLQAQNFDIGSVGELTAVPSLLKERWLYRIDLPIQIRRQVSRQYPVLNVLSIDGTLATDDGIQVPVSGP